MASHIVPKSEADNTLRDIVIPVMGSTGAGKSTFINSILGRDCMIVGHEIESCTVDIATAEVDPSRLTHIPWLKKRRVFLVDTPGFDDTYKDDAEILRRIAKWLGESYHKRVLGGVIYLHDISADRFTGTVKRNLLMFNRLCGEDALANVVLGITKTGRIPPDEAKKREDRLKNLHWKNMIDRGTRVFQVSEAHSLGQAWKLLNGVFEGFEKTFFLNIQRELVEKNRIIPQTEAGKELRYTLQQVLEQQKKFAQSSVTSENVEEAKKQIENLTKQLQELKVPLSRRLRALLGF